MTRQEFISTLGAKLSEEFSTAEVLSQTQYYQGYIDGEMKKGKTEEEILDELGDPLLIAKTILESPREDSSYGYVRSQQESYDEGAYQGEYQNSAEDIKAQMRDSRDATARKYREAQDRAMMHQAEREAAASRNSSQYGGSQSAYGFSENQYGGSQSAYGSSESQYGGSQSAYGSAAGQQYGNAQSAYGESRSSGAYAGEEAGEYYTGDQAYRSMEADDEPQHVSGEVEGKGSLMRDANGDFNWGMLALIVGVVLVLVAIAWIVGKILAFFGPLLIVLLIVFLIMHFAKGDK